MRVLVVGSGWVAREVWLPRLTAHSKFQLVGVVDPDPAAAARVAGLIGTVPVHTDHRRVPLDDVEVAFVLTPNHTHGRIGEWFLRRGRSVFLEKPTGVDRGQLELLRRAARAGGGRLVLSAAARYRADVGELRRIVLAGDLGDPRTAVLSWVRARGIPRSGWFTDRDSAGGGVLIDLGWHLVDVVQQLWGAAPIRSVGAAASADHLRAGGWDAGWRGAGDPGRPSATSVEDRLDGFVATDTYGLMLRFGWASHEPVDVTTIALHGTYGSAVLEATFGFSPCRVAEPRLTLTGSGVTHPVPLPEQPVGAEYDRQLDALVDDFEDPRVSERSLAAADDVLAVIDARYRAARLG